MEVVDTPRSSRRDTDLSPHSAHPVTPSGASLAPAFARSALPRERVRSLAQMRCAAIFALALLLGSERTHFGHCKTEAIDPCGHLTGEWSAVNRSVAS